MGDKKITYPLPTPHLFFFFFVIHTRTDLTEVSTGEPVA